jgi:DNA-binding transcriptional MerR regulator
MEKLYSVKDIQKLFGFKARRIRYWDKIGFLTPSVRIGTGKYYTSQDLIGLRTARGLFDAGLSFAEVRRSVIDLKRTSSGAAKPHSLPFIGPEGKERVLDRDAARSNLRRQFLIGFSQGDFERGIKSASMQFKADVKPQGHASRRRRQTHGGRRGPVKSKNH